MLALEMASPGNRHCASCIGTLSFPACTVTECSDFKRVTNQHGRTMGPVVERAGRRRVMNNATHAVDSSREYRPTDEPTDGRLLVLGTCT